MTPGGTAVFGRRLIHNSIVALLIWVYYTSQIVLMGAEVTHAYAKHEGSIRQRRSRDGRENVRPLSRPGGPSGRRANGVLVER